VDENDPLHHLKNQRSFQNWEGEGDRMLLLSLGFERRRKRGRSKGGEILATVRRKRFLQGREGGKT